MSKMGKNQFREFSGQLHEDMRVGKIFASYC